MALKFIPKIVYNSITLNLTIPQKLWTPSSKPYGGGNVSDSGIPEAFIIRRDQLVKAEIRFTEGEWASVDAWLDWGQRGNIFDFWFDQNDAATTKTMYLVSPAIGDGEVSPTRESYRHIYTLQVTMRTTNNALISVLT